MLLAERSRQGGKTPFGVTCERLLFPFGANVSYKPISSKNESRLHQVGKQVLTGICIGYVFLAGGGWSCNVLIACWEDMANLSVSEVDVQRFKHQEVSLEQNPPFPCADGSIKLFNLPRPHRGEQIVEGKPQSRRKKRKNNHRRSRRDEADANKYRME